MISKPADTFPPSAHAARVAVRRPTVHDHAYDSLAPDRACELIGWNKRVLVLGSLSLGLVHGLHAQNCRISTSECEPSETGHHHETQVDPLGEPNLLKGVPLRERFDVVLVSDGIISRTSAETLLRGIPPLLERDGFVLAEMRTAPLPHGGLARVGEGTASSASRRMAAPPVEALNRGSMVSLFEKAGYAVSQIEPDAGVRGSARLRVDMPEMQTTLSHERTSERGVGPHRILIVAHPVPGDELEWVKPLIRKAAEEKKAALDEAEILRAEVRSLALRLTRAEDRLARSVQRERETRQQFLKAHEHLATGDIEFRSITRLLIREREETEMRLRKIIDEVAAHRDELESRLLRLRRSPLGRLYGFAQSLVARIRN